MDRVLVFLCLALALASPATASFALYYGREPASFAQEIGVSASCMTALNKTIDCDGIFMSRVLQLEQYGWTASNMSAACTSGCATGLQSWVSNVQSACASDVMRQEGTLIKPATLPLMYQHGHDLACMQGGGGSGWCWVDSLGWQGSDIRRYARDTCATGHEEYDNDLCFTEGFDPAAIEPGDVRLANLYDKSMVCSDCFLKILTHRLKNPLLAQGEYTGYLLDQHDDLEEFCSTSMPVTTPSRTLVVGTVPPPTPTTGGSVTGTVPPPATTCDGQLIQPPTEPMDCSMLSQEYNVTTGDLTVLTGDWSCFITQPVCLPKPCQLQSIGWGETCESVRASISTPEKEITNVQFSDWNPRIIGPCDGLRGEQSICTSPPGGEYKPPPPVYAPTSSVFYTTALPPLPTSTGTTDDCGKYYSVASGDTCNTIALQAGITINKFLSLNTQVWENCTNLWLDYAYCVADVTEPPVSSSGSCGPDNGHAICAGSGFGECCSFHGFCGSGPTYCGGGNCYSGACTGPQTGVTEDGTCGPDHNEWLCGDSEWGSCCSIYGYCGNSAAHCGAGMCYSGNCDPDVGGPSLDGSCGPSFAGNKTCTGTPFGDCCSNYGYCGNGPDYCSAENCHSGACEGT